PRQTQTHRRNRRSPRALQRRHHHHQRTRLPTNGGVRAMDELTNKLLERSDLDAERMFLTSLILDPSGFEQPEALLPDEAFYSEAHRKIYAAARAVHRATGCADAHLIAMHARDNGWREAPLAVAGLLTEG